MAIVIFITHGRQEYCLTKHLVIIFNTGFCITLILAALTPCARRPGTADRGRYGGRLLQAGCVVVYVTYWTWSAMQSSPERPGIVELATFLMDEDDLTCRVHNTHHAEKGLLGAAFVMMFITVAYIGSDMSGVRQRTAKKPNNLSRSTIPVSFPSNESCATSANGGQQMLERHEQPRFCVCLQQMPEPTLSPDWFDMQPTQELAGGQVHYQYVKCSTARSMTEVFLSESHPQRVVPYFLQLSLLPPLDGLGHHVHHNAIDQMVRSNGIYNNHHCSRRANPSFLILNAVVLLFFAGVPNRRL
jgi:hypothetical protein